MCTSTMLNVCVLLVVASLVVPTVVVGRTLNKELCPPQCTTEDRMNLAFCVRGNRFRSLCEVREAACASIITNREVFEAGPCGPPEVIRPKRGSIWCIFATKRGCAGQGGPLEMLTGILQPLVKLFTVTATGEGSILAPILNFFGVKEDRGGFLSLIGIKDGKDGTPLGVLEYNRIRHPEGKNVYFRPFDLLQITHKDNSTSIWG